MSDTSLASETETPLKIVLSHPHGNPNSYQAARTLAEMGWLDRFETGFLPPDAASPWFRLLPRHLQARARNRRYEGIPRTKLRGHFLTEAISRLGKRVRPQGIRSNVNWYDVLFCGHDRVVSRMLPADLDAVFAYEDAAHRTFTAAKARSAATIYELPLGYFEGVACELRLAQRERPQLHVAEMPAWKRERKRAELAAANVVLVPCAWARETLRFSDKASRQPVLTIPYATPADTVPGRSSAAAGPFTVLFAGQIGVRKGIPYLLEAWNRLRLPDAELLLAGQFAEDCAGIQMPPRVRHLGALPHASLLDVMRKSDLFVFPSLAEGFGLVIGEAMACGVPVLTTVNTGGPELITDAREGWCVQPRDTGALCDALEWSHAHRDALWQMGLAARARAENWTWAHYRSRLAAELQSRLK